jgi:type II secretory pathway pseudopilin PulG
MSIDLSSKFQQKAPSATLSKIVLSLLQQRTTVRQHSEQGWTLLEGLLAMVVIAITVVSISPPLLWATATRVQNQRAEQALKLAQSEIDRVRAAVERGETDSGRLNRLPSVAGDEAFVRNGAGIAAPTAPKATTMISSRDTCAADNGIAPAVNQFLQVDTNGDCTPDFLIQTFRSQGLDGDANRFGNGTGTNNTQLAGFVMGVRVYSVLADAELRAGRGQRVPAPLKATSGLGNQRTHPLAVMYSTIVRSSSSSNLAIYQRLCPAGSGTC